MQSISSFLIITPAHYLLSYVITGPLCQLSDVNFKFCDDSVPATGWEQQDGSNRMGDPKNHTIEGNPRANNHLVEMLTRDSWSCACGKYVHVESTHRLK